MADPLSILGIAASVAGLLQVAGNVSGALYDFSSGVTVASKSARAALITIENMRMVLSSIQQLLENGLVRIPESRKKMIHISKLVIIFRESIIAFSELEAMVDLATKTATQRSRTTGFKWMCKQENFLRCIQQLESHKTSLSTMLSILHCESDLEAQQGLQSLQSNFALLVQQHQDLLRRFEEHNHSLRPDKASLRFFDDDASTVRPRTDVGRVSEDSNQAIPVAAPADSRQSCVGLHLETPIRDFENTLNGTRVYRRAQADQCDVSFNESATRSHGWSALSDLSLTDVSVISVIALPITLDEINSIGANLTFAAILSPPSVVTVLQPAPPLRSRNSTLVRRSQADSYNIVVLGDPAVETTALTIQLCRGHGYLDYFLNEYSFRKQLTVDNIGCNLEICDSGTSTGEFFALRYQIMQAGDGFVVMYPICNRASFQRVEWFADEIATIPSPHTCGATILVGNHWHRGAEREVSAQEAATLADKFGWGFAEVSVEQNLNVEEVFAGLVRMIRSRRVYWDIETSASLFDSRAVNV